MKWELWVICSLMINLSWAQDTAGESLTGHVLEVKEVTSYTYLRLKTKDGELWAAVNKAPVKVGSDVVIEHTMLMHNFVSPSLHTTFKEIVFGTLGLADVTATMGIATVPLAHAGIPPVTTANIQVPKASGHDAYRVVDLIKQRQMLKGKTVVLHAQVVKFNPDIMGRNWLHLRDGSGSEQEGTQDILVTSPDTVKVGDVITIRGKLETDKDFGSGYFYKVLVEDAHKLP